ncbi:MAG: hypothetical protein Q4C49_01610 [Bacillota bacterium]|nr:hypothetical protein [Bacillota bacterium]
MITAVFKEKWLCSMLKSLKIPYVYFEEKEKLIACVKKNDVVFVFEDKSLVEQLNKKGEINCIYISSGQEDCLWALQEHVSGYLVHPFEEKMLLKEMHYLRYGKFKKPLIRCFGRFDLFVDGQSVPFPRKKSKELLAFLVLKRGEPVTVDEVCQFLFGVVDDTKRNYVYVSKFELMKVLKKVEMEDLFVLSEKCFRINTELFDCDLYQYLDGDLSLYSTDFMRPYPWAKSVLEELVK